MLLDFLDNREKWIIQKPRTVILSSELKQKINAWIFDKDNEQADNEKIYNDFHYIKNKLELGEDINWHFSGKIFSSEAKYKDMLLNTWSIHHIHLSQMDTVSKNGMKRNRSNNLLFCIINNDCVYCIDIISHPDSNRFFCYNLLNIIELNGWMQLIGYTPMNDKNYVVGSLQPKITDDAILTQLYVEGKVNSAFEFNGRAYFKLNGISSTGDIISNSQELLTFKKYIGRCLCKGDEFVEIQNFDVDSDKIITGIVAVKRNGNLQKYQIKL